MYSYLKVRTHHLDFLPSGENVKTNFEITQKIFILNV